MSHCSNNPYNLSVHEKRQLENANTEMTQMLELSDRDFKALCGLNVCVTPKFIC